VGERGGPELITFKKGEGFRPLRGEKDERHMRSKKKEKKGKPTDVRQKGEKKRDGSLMPSAGGKGTEKWKVTTPPSAKEKRKEKRGGGDSHEKCARKKKGGSFRNKRGRAGGHLCPLGKKEREK